MHIHCSSRTRTSLVASNGGALRGSGGAAKRTSILELTCWWCRGSCGWRQSISGRPNIIWLTSELHLVSSPNRGGEPCASTLTAIRVVAHRSAASGARPERWGRVSIGQNIPSRPFKTVPQGQVCGSTTFRARHVERVLHTCARCGMMPSSPGLGNSFVGTAVKNCLINVTSTPSGGSMRP